jgi:hypothetical protein
MQQQVRAAGGYQRATDALLDFVSKRASFTRSRSMEA